MRGRPKLGDGNDLVSVTIKLRLETLTALRAYAAANDYSIASVVRMALRQFLGLAPHPEKKIN